MGRKTVKVEDLKDKVNDMLLHLPDRDMNGREQLQSLIENVLMNTGNYSGFRYLDADDMVRSDNGLSVGINEVNGESLPYDKRFEDVDHTRVKYF